MLKKLRLREENGFLKKMKTCSGPVIQFSFSKKKKKKKRIDPSAKNFLSSFEESSSVLNLSTWSASFVVPNSRSVSTISYVAQFFSEAAHDATYWPTVILPLGGQETTPKTSTTQGQGTTTFTSLSCSVITCTEHNLKKGSVRHAAIRL